MRYKSNALFLTLVAAWTSALAVSSARADLLVVFAGTTKGVARYDQDSGAFLGVFASSGGNLRPNGLAFGPDGDLYVSDFSVSGGVFRYDGTTGAFMEGPSHLKTQN
jgi:hypothetical protein